MRLRALFISVSAAVCLSGTAVAQTPPVVTIDSSKNFCVNGSPVFLIGTMGGDASAWQNYLKPAGFNFRFLGTTTTPGAHSVGLWEVPDVLDNPSAVATMRNELFGNDGFDRDFKNEAQTKDAVWAARQTGTFRKSAAPAVRSINVYGATERRNGGWAGNYTAATIAADFGRSSHLHNSTPYSCIASFGSAIGSCTKTAVP